MVRRLLERVGQLQQLRLGKRASQQLDAHGHPIVGKPGWHRDRRQSRCGAGVAVAAGLRLTNSRRRPSQRRVDQRGDAIVVHRLEQRLAKLRLLGRHRAVFIRVERGHVIGSAEAPLDGRMKQSLLEDFRQAVYRRAWRAREILVQVKLELERDQRHIAFSRHRRQRHVHRLSPLLLHSLHRGSHDAADPLVVRGVAK